MKGRGISVGLGTAYGVALVVVLLSTGCRDNTATPTKSAVPAEKSGSGLSVGKRNPPSSKQRVSFSAPEFVRAEEQAGLRFAYDNGATGKWLMPETTGGGGGWIDFDRDGRCDAYLIQAGPANPQDVRTRPPNRLFRNVNGTSFEDVTLKARVGDTGYGHGIAIGDFDNDGFDDIYVTNVGHNVLYQNQGDGTFRNVTDSSGTDDAAWSSCAAWGDIDQDGDLDLFVCNYMKYDLKNPRICKKKDGSPGTCHPENLDPVPNECFLNLGDGTFRRVAAERGLRGKGSKSLGVVIADFNEDRLPDIFVANDTTANFLYLNQGDGRFRESGHTSGCALNSGGNFQASMGVALADYDRNGHLDLYVTHFTDDSNTMYTNLGPAGFEDRTRRLGLHQPTLKYLGFGTVMADFNQDGHMDLFVANGRIDDWRQRGELWTMPDQLFSYAGGRWNDCSRRGGSYFRESLIGRGVAYGDYDNDGDVDLLVIQQNAPTALLKNVSKRGHWLKIELVGRSSNRRGIGARVTVSQNKDRLVHELAGGVSYCAANQPVAIFGLGSSSDDCTVTVQWPSGVVQKVDHIKVDQRVVLTEP